MSHWIPRAELNAYQPQLDTFAVCHLEADLQFPTLNAEDHYFPSLEKHALSRVEGRGQGRFAQLPTFHISERKSPLIPLLSKIIRIEVSPFCKIMGLGRA